MAHEMTETQMLDTIQRLDDRLRAARTAEAVAKHDSQANRVHGAEYRSIARGNVNSILATFAGIEGVEDVQVCDSMDEVLFTLTGVELFEDANGERLIIGKQHTYPVTISIEMTAQMTVYVSGPSEDEVHDEVATAVRDALWTWEADNADHAFRDADIDTSAHDWTVRVGHPADVPLDLHTRDVLSWENLY